MRVSFLNAVLGEQVCEIDGENAFQIHNNLIYDICWYHTCEISLHDLQNVIYHIHTCMIECHIFSGSKINLIKIYTNLTKSLFCLTLYCM